MQDSWSCTYLPQSCRFLPEHDRQSLARSSLLRDGYDDLPLMTASPSTLEMMVLPALCMLMNPQLIVHV